MDTKILVYISIIIVLFVIVIQVAMSFKKYRVYKTNQIAKFNDYLFKKYGRVFKLVLYEKNNCLYAIDDNCYFRVMQNSMGVITDNKDKSVVGYLLSNYLSDKIDMDGVYISASVNSIYGLDYDTIEEILANNDKILIHIVLGIIVNDKDNLDKIERMARDLCEKIEFKNTEIDVLFINAVNGKELRDFIDMYYISDGDISAYPGHIKRFFRINKEVD